MVIQDTRGANRHLACALQRHGASQLLGLQAAALYRSRGGAALLGKIAFRSCRSCCISWAVRLPGKLPIGPFQCQNCGNHCLGVAGCSPGVGSGVLGGSPHALHGVRSGGAAHLVPFRAGGEDHTGGSHTPASHNTIDIVQHTPRCACVLVRTNEAPVFVRVRAHLGPSGS